jgi:hypothetical protein
MKSIPTFPGSELRARREELGFSIYEAFRKTRVPANYIEALEQGDILNLPATCYAAGFLKTYCEFLGLNPEVPRVRASFRDPFPARRSRRTFPCPGLASRFRNVGGDHGGHPAELDYVLRGVQTANGQSRQTRASGHDGRAPVPA